jgi:hypothetical protein
MLSSSLFYGKHIFGLEYLKAPRLWLVLPSMQNNLKLCSQCRFQIKEKTMFMLCTMAHFCCY